MTKIGLLWTAILASSDDYAFLSRELRPTKRWTRSQGPNRRVQSLRRKDSATNLGYISTVCLKRLNRFEYILESIKDFRRILYCTYIIKWHLQMLAYQELVIERWHWLIRQYPNSTQSKVILNRGSFDCT